MTAFDTVDLNRICSKLMITNITERYRYETKLEENTSRRTRAVDDHVLGRTGDRICKKDIQQNSQGDHVLKGTSANLWEIRQNL